MRLSEKFRQKCINRADWIRKNSLDSVTAYKVISLNPHHFLVSSTNLSFVLNCWMLSAL